MWCLRCYAWVQKFTASRTGTHNWPCGHDAGITNVEPIRWKADE